MSTPKARTKAQNRNHAKGAVCEYCGKRTYASKAYAKRASKILYPGEPLRPYRCPRAPEYVDVNNMWHLGHLNDFVLNGTLSRDERYGGPSNTRKTEARYSVPQVMLDIMKDKQAPAEAVSDEGAHMATVGELARVVLTGFDKKTSQHKDVDLQSSGRDKVAMVYTAIRAYAVAHGFEPGDYNGKNGLVGRVSLKALAGELFGIAPEDDRIRALTAQIIDHAKRQQAFVCLDNHAVYGDVLPIWWISSSYAVPAVTEKATKAAAAAPKEKEEAASPPLETALPAAEKPKTVSKKLQGKRVKRPPERVIDRSFAVKAVLGNVAAKYGTALTRAEVNEELAATGGTVLSAGEFETAAKYLEETKVAVMRKMTDDDVATIQATGGNAPHGRRPFIVMLRKHSDNGVIPPLLGTLAQLKETSPVVAEEEEAVSAPPPIPEDLLPAAPLQPEAVAQKEEPTPAPSPAPEAVPADLSKGGIIVAQNLPPLRSTPPQTAVAGGGPYKALFERAEARIAELEAENAKLRSARDGLLVVIETLK